MREQRKHPESGNDVLAKFVRLESRKRDLSQSELADMTGLSRTHISNIETGERLPSPETFRKICNALKCDWGKAVEVYLKAFATHHDWSELRRFLTERTTESFSQRRRVLSFEGFPSRSRASAAAMMENVLAHLREVVYATLQFHPETPYKFVPSINEASFKPYRDCKFLEYSPIIHTRKTPGFSFGRFRIRGKSFAIHRHHGKVFEVSGTEAFVVEQGQGILMIEKLPPDPTVEGKIARVPPRFTRFAVSPGASGHYAGELCHVWINPNETPLDVTITTVPFLTSPKLKRNFNLLNDLESWNIHPASYTLEEADDAPIPDVVRREVEALRRRNELESDHE